MHQLARCRLGLPAWAFPGWQDRYFDARQPALAGYASVFDTVEGNTTFYRIPDPTTVARWQQIVDGSDFEFCFKLPRTVTHERRPAIDDLAAFLTAIEPLGRHVGPLLLQFPASVGPAELNRFEAVLGTVTERYRAVLEVRHAEFFARPEALDPLLERFALGRVVLDTRALYGGDLQHPEVQAALHEKPDLPVQARVHNDVAFVRLVLHPDEDSNDRYLTDWAERVAHYLKRGVQTWMMVHCPNNLHCPALAREFHRRLGECLTGLPALPAWPVPQQARLL